MILLGFECAPPIVVSEQVCTAKMNLSDEVDLEDYVSRPDKISAAEVCFLVQFGEYESSIA